ncbi:hypothetical protein LX83_004903 [Goodfellowiella coeruleoviolacea]|uniref:Uncharacterized protein n=1 Tax=Goodfellowiella coeruleoviolacea TaxID=334858 RepID=A0AAE3GIL6_9PSEU|nr:hypothetical protein [Goodfellowiella coeruleoviolacea]
MTRTGRGAMADFTEARTATDRSVAAQRFQAARTVADHSLGVDDCRELLSMLGLSDRGPNAAPAHAARVRAGREQHTNHSHRDAPGASGQPKEHVDDSGNGQVVQW